MSFKVSFLDNQVCGVDDFNNILADIVQGGVVGENFDETIAYQMSKMNVVTKDVVSQGVAASEKSLACSMGTDGVYIAPGVGIFGSGAKIKVTESEFVAVGGIRNAYVYAYHDMKNNIAGLKAANDGFPAEIDGEMYILPLCQIVEGVFADKREYAKAKLNVCDVVNTTKEFSDLTVPNVNYDEQDYVFLEAGKNTRVNFLVFVASGIFIVKEPEYGVFDIKGISSRNGGWLDETVYLADSSGSNYTYLTDFKRDANGNICARVNSGLLGTSYKYTLYASVYEEVSK